MNQLHFKHAKPVMLSFQFAFAWFKITGMNIHTEEITIQIVIIQNITRIAQKVFQQLLVQNENCKSTS